VQCALSAVAKTARHLLLSPQRNHEKGCFVMRNERIFGLAAAVSLGLVAGAVPSIGLNAQDGLGSGIASFYGSNFHGKRTASGEIFSNSKMTAAHRSLRFGSMVRVTNLRNGKQVIVRVNDRGPWTGGRVIDLSRAAASQIDMIGSGTARVSLEKVN
jgi:rare lipoprotein A